MSFIKDGRKEAVPRIHLYVASSSSLHLNVLLRRANDLDLLPFVSWFLKRRLFLKHINYAHLFTGINLPVSLLSSSKGCLGGER